MWGHLGTMIPVRSLKNYLDMRTMNIHRYWGYKM